MLLDNPENKKYVDSVSHNCRMVKNKGIAKFDIIVNDRNVMETEEQLKEPEHKRNSFVSIGTFDYVIIIMNRAD